MANKKFVIDFDLDDRSYREKLDNLIRASNKLNTGSGASGSGASSGLGSSDRLAVERMRMEEAQSRFNSQYSASERSVASARVNAGPFEGGASQRDHKIHSQSVVFDEMSKNLKEGQKLQRSIFFEDRKRHREYRSLSTRQLEVSRRTLRRQATKDEKSGNFDSAEQKRGDVAALSSIIDQRKGNTQQERAMRSIATNMFVNQALGGLQSFGKGGAALAGSARAGQGAYGAMRANGSSQGASSLVGLLVAGVTALAARMGDVYDVQKTMARTFSTQGGGGGDAKMFGAIEKHDSFRQMGYTIEDIAKKTEHFAKTSGHGGSSSANLIEGLHEELIVKRALGVDEASQAMFAKTALPGNRLHNSDAILGIAQMLEHKGAGGVKVGIGPDGKIGDRNLVKVPDYLKRIVELNESMHSATFKKDKEQQLDSIKMMSSIIGMGGVFKQDDVASKMASGMRSSFANPKDALEEYENRRAFFKVHGGASELDYAKEKGNFDDMKVQTERIRGLEAKNRVSTMMEGGHRQTDFYAQVAGKFGISGPDAAGKGEQIYKSYQSHGNKFNEADMSHFGHGAMAKLTPAAMNLSTTKEGLEAGLDNATFNASKATLEATGALFDKSTTAFSAAVGDFQAAITTLTVRIEDMHVISNKKYEKPKTLVIPPPAKPRTGGIQSTLKKLESGGGKEASPEMMEWMQSMQ